MCHLPLTLLKHSSIPLENGQSGMRHLKHQDGLEAATRDKGLKKAMSDAGVDAEAITKAKDILIDACTEMKLAAKALEESDREEAGTPQGQAEFELEQAEQELLSVVDKMSAVTASGKLAAEMCRLGERAANQQGRLEQIMELAGIDPDAFLSDAEKEHPPGDMDKAAGYMSKASNQLKIQDCKDAGSHQEKALTELRAHFDVMQKLRDKAMTRAAADADCRGQKSIADDLAELSDDMSEGENGNPVPGYESVRNASGTASSAAEGMFRFSTDGNAADSKEANEDQQKTIDELTEALAALSQSMAEEDETGAEEEQDLLVLALETILARQKQITASTLELYNQHPDGDPAWSREQRLIFSNLSDGEGKLSTEMMKVHDDLVKAGGSILFPDITRNVASDLAELRKRLAENDPGLLTQQLQKAVETSIEGMLAAIEGDDSEQSPPPPGGG